MYICMYLFICSFVDFLFVFVHLLVSIFVNVCSYLARFLCVIWRGLSFCGQAPSDRVSRSHAELPKPLNEEHASNHTEIIMVCCDVFLQGFVKF